MTEFAPVTDERWLDMALSGNLDDRAAVAGDPEAPLVVLDHLRRDPGRRIREAVLKNPSAPTQWLQDAIEVNDHLTPGTFAARSLPLPFLQATAARYVDERDSDRLAKLVRNPGWDETSLLQFTQNASADVRMAIIWNPAVTEAVLWALADDSAPSVRAEVAHASGATLLMREHLLADPEHSATVIAALLDHEDIRSQALAFAEQSPHTSVKEQAVKYTTNEAFLASLVDERSERLKAAAAAKTTNPDTLMRFACDPSKMVRKQVQLNPHATEEARIAAALHDS